MALKKWLLLFFSALLGCAALLAGFNVLVDPFGVFGDRVLNWYEYDMTMNPRVAKIAYLDRHHESYDSYVIGSSKASSISVHELNKYMDASFYNMTWYGGDLVDELALVHYIIEHYTVKNIVLTVDPQCAALFNTGGDSLKEIMHCRADGSSALRFYARYLFANPEYNFDKLAARLKQGYLQQSAAVYTAETGSYNKQVRDATPIGDLSEYLALENNVFDLDYSTLPYLDEAIAAIADIKRTCEDNSVNLTVIGVPIYRDDFARYDPARLAQFWEALAGVTDFYDFWGGSSVNRDIRYFYDSDHFRNNAGTMALAYIFGGQDIYIPEDFGHLTTAANVRDRIAAAFENTEIDPDSYLTRVPILMYHSFTDDPESVNDMTVCIGDFKEQIAALRAAGYQPVLYQELVDYVRRGTELPEHPILISIDDGYQNNLDLAVPVLEENGFRAAIAVIGCSVGKTTYKDTDTPVTPHFTLESAKPFVERGVLDIHSHSYDMHQVAALDGEGCRQGVLQMDGERESDYVETLTADYSRSKAQIQSVLDVSCNVFTYPYGLCDTLSEAVLHSLGAEVTVTTKPGINVIIKGIPQSLYQLKRINVSGGVTADELLQTLSGYLTADGIG